MNATAIRQTLLENGAVMGREEFHRLFEQCEELERAELVEGVVYLPSRVSTLYHGRQLALVLQWLVHYELLHDPDVEAVGPTSILLDDLNEPLPDATLFRTRADRFEGGYIKGAPELIVEVSDPSTWRDMYPKKEAYRRNGVLEYIVWRVRDGAIDWFQLRGGTYVLRSPDVQGIIESEVFPGLRLDVAAALVNNRKRVLAAVREE